MTEPKFQNLDSDESIFFTRELEAIKGRTYDKKYPALKARDLIPVSFEAGAGAESITYRQFEEIGLAALIANYGDDLPRADVAGREFTSPVKSLGIGYGYNVQEVRAAILAGRSLPDMKANASRRGAMTKENQLALLGDPVCGFVGFLDPPNIIDVTIPADGVGASKTFASKVTTPDLIIRDLNSLATAVHDTTKGVEAPRTLLLPLEQYNLIWNTPRLSGSDMSVAKWFLENSPHIQEIEWVSELKGIGPGGVDRMMVYDRDPDKLTLEVPQDYEQFPVQERNLEFVVPAHQRFGGVVIYYPLSMAKGDGI